MNGIPRRFWVLLAASLALNLFCLGFFTARALPGRQHKPHIDHDDGRSPRAFLRRSGLLDAGPEVTELMRGHRPRVRENMRAVSEARNRAQAAMSAEPFDPEQLQTALKEVRTLTESMQADMHNVLGQVATKLDKQQRARVADALWRGASRGPGL